MSAKKDFSGRLFCCGHGAQNFYGPAQAFAIAYRHGRKRRTTGARLAKWKIAAQDQISRIGKCIGYGGEQFALAISARAVGKNQSVTMGLRGFVEKATDCGFG
jgi:hypothetical protein